MNEAVNAGAKAAQSVIDNLKEQPLVLALVLFNLAFIAAVYFAGLDARDHQEKASTQLVELMRSCISQQQTIKP